MVHLLYLLNISPISTTCVEILFLKRKLIKTCLRNKVGQVILDQFLGIGMELPKEIFDDSLRVYVVEKTEKSELNFDLILFVFCFTDLIF